MKNNSENNCKQIINTKEQLLNINQAAEILNVTKTTIRNWERDGKIKSTRTIGNHRRYRLCDVMKMTKGHQMQETSNEYVEIKSNGEIRLDGITIQKHQGETKLFLDGVFIDLKILQKYAEVKNVSLFEEAKKVSKLQKQKMTPAEKASADWPDKFREKIIESAKSNKSCYIWGEQLYLDALCPLILADGFSVKKAVDPEFGHSLQLSGWDGSEVIIQNLPH